MHNILLLHRCHADRQLVISAESDRCDYNHFLLHSHAPPVYTGDTFSVQWSGQNHNVLRLSNAEKVVLDPNSCTNPNTGPQCNFVIPQSYSCNEVIKLYCGEHPTAMFLTIGVGNVSALSAPSVEDLSNYQYAHGALMFLAFGIFLPVGGFLVQSGRVKCDHPLCQALASSSIM